MLETAEGAGRGITSPLSYGICYSKCKITKGVDEMLKADEIFVVDELKRRIHSDVEWYQEDEYESKVLCIISSGSNGIYQLMDMAQRIDLDLSDFELEKGILSDVIPVEYESQVMEAYDEILKELYELLELENVGITLFFTYSEADGDFVLMASR